MSKIAEHPKLAIGIIILLLGTSATGFGLAGITNSNNQTNYNHLLAQYQTLNSSYNTLNFSYGRLVLQYTDLVNTYELLSSNFTTLNATYQQLVANYKQMQHNYVTLQSNYTNLQTNYAQLQLDFNTLQSLYTTLLEGYNTLQVQYTSLQQSFTLLRDTLLQLPVQYRLLLIYEYIRQHYEPNYPDWQGYADFMAKLVLHDTAQYNYFTIPQVLQELLPSTSWREYNGVWQTPSTSWVWQNGVTFMWDGPNGMNIVLTGKAYVDPTYPVLTLTTKYEIEQYWDYGFVQVSTDNGTTWTSLSNTYTTWYSVPDGYYKIVSNLPGLTGTSANYPDNWVTMYFDLSAYNTKTILIGFRYMTDWGNPSAMAGWFINTASVSGVTLNLNAEQSYQESDFAAFVTIAELAYNMRQNDYGQVGWTPYIWATSGLTIPTIHNWIVSHTSYEADGNFANYSPLWDYPKFPMETLLRTMGDCEDQAMLDATFLESNVNSLGARYETVMGIVHDPTHPTYGAFYHAFLWVKLGSTTTEAWNTLTSWGVPISGTYLWRFGSETEYTWRIFDPTWDTQAGYQPPWLQNGYENSSQFNTNMNFAVVSQSWLGTSSGIGSLLNASCISI